MSINRYIFVCKGIGSRIEDHDAITFIQKESINNRIDRWCTLNYDRNLHLHDLMCLFLDMQLLDKKKKGFKVETRKDRIDGFVKKIEATLNLNEAARDRKNVPILLIGVSHGSLLLQRVKDILEDVGYGYTNVTLLTIGSPMPTGDINFRHELDPMLKRYKWLIKCNYGPCQVNKMKLIWDDQDEYHTNIGIMFAEAGDSCILPNSINVGRFGELALQSVEYYKGAFHNEQMVIWNRRPRYFRIPWLTNKIVPIE